MIPTTTITARSATGGRRRPQRAPATPPMIDPIAISSAGSHATCEEKMKMIPATRLTSPASTTLSALTR